MNRGACHQKIFCSSSDYEYMHNLLLKTKSTYEFNIHSYCFMSNHYHFLIETFSDNISMIMKKIDESYTRYFNTLYNRDGPLFRGRFKSCDITDDEYFLQTNRYISLNPVKACIVDLPHKYHYSSYPGMLGIKHDPLLTKNRTLNYFYNKDISLYKNFVESRIIYSDFEDRIIKELGDMD